MVLNFSSGSRAYLALLGPFRIVNFRTGVISKIKLVMVSISFVYTNKYEHRYSYTSMQASIVVIKLMMQVAQIASAIFCNATKQHEQPQRNDRQPKQ